MTRTLGRAALPEACCEIVLDRSAGGLILNTISTAAMVSLGKMFGNLMVDVVPSNTKLRARARRTVELVTEASSDEAEAALEAARGDAKVAIVSLLAGVGAYEARCG